MGWICITDDCEGHIDVDTGMWENGEGIAYFSIADEIGVFHDVFFEFLLGISGPVYMMGAIVLIMALIGSIMIKIRRSFKNVV